MPECIEVEQYRAALDTTVGAAVAAVELADGDYLRGRATSRWSVEATPDAITASELGDELVGLVVAGTRRRGKLALWDFVSADDASSLQLTVGLRFGMTGRLVVGDLVPIEQLEYASDRDDPAWERVAFVLDDGRRVAIRDQRRLGSIELDPDEDSLGPDVWGLDRAALDSLLDGSARPLKSRLLDQAVLAGLGNLLTDEILWRAGIDPRAPARALGAQTRSALLDTMANTLSELTRRGGSHTGDLQPHRHEGARCPLDGGQLERHTIGGRTTYACRLHQAGTGWDR